MNKTIKKPCDQVELIKLYRLKPHEQISPTHLSLLAEKINQDCRWLVPIIIDKDTGIIMDGHHRYHIAFQLGFTRIPCYQMSYHSDDVKIYHWQTSQPFDYRKILNIVASGKVFPPKTTHHVFDKLFDKVNIEFDDLR